MSDFNISWINMFEKLANKGLHQTRRGGVLASRAVVEARLAGEATCWADLKSR